MISRKQKTLHFLRTHRLAVWVGVALVLYTVGHILRWELTGRGTELIAYPTIEVILERFLNES